MRPALLDPLFSPLSSLPGIGPRLGELFARLLGQESLEECRVVDLLFHFPHGIVDRRRQPGIAHAPQGTIVTVTGRVDRHQPPPTARSMIFVTPDGERSMNTYLGACVELGPEDVEESVVAEAKVTYFEGYLWDPPRAKDAIRDCARIAHANGREMSMTLSDSFCVHRYRDEFLDLMRSGTIDIVFANKAEALALYETEDFEEALSRIAKDCRLAVVTMSEEGSVILTGGERTRVEAISIPSVVDTTGAGDLYAAGFLYGYTAGRSLADCGRLGSLAAGLVIQQVGPRPLLSLAEEARKAGLT